MSRELEPRPIDAAPPALKVPGKRPVRIRPPSDRLPVPHYRISRDALADPLFAPPPPPRGFWLYKQIPRYHLRGIGPADSIILRHAIARGWFDVADIFLTPLIPWAPPPIPDGVISRDLEACPTAPFQPDLIVLTHDRAEVIEIKPNAGYVAFGQVLAYHWAWSRHFGSTLPLAPAILTDQPRPYLVGMAADYGVHLHALGDLLVEPPPFPT